MSELVQKLSEGRHPVVVSLRPERSVKALRECLTRGYVHIRFPHTRGGTELGVTVDAEQSDLTSADLDGETGRLRVVGTLNLDYVDVRCVAEVELPHLEGIGYLEPITA